MWFFEKNISPIHRDTVRIVNTFVSILVKIARTNYVERTGFVRWFGQNNSAVNRRTRYYRLIARFVPIVNEFESILIDRSLNFHCFPTIIHNATLHCLLLPEKTFSHWMQARLAYWIGQTLFFFKESPSFRGMYKNLSRNSYWSVWKGLLLGNATSELSR